METEIKEKIIVSSHGYGDAQLFFLTGIPFKEDFNKGLAISGHNENTINGFLKEEGLHINNTYRSSYIKELPEYTGKNPKRLAAAMAKLDLRNYDNLLIEELKDVKPTVIIPLDDLALSAVYPAINGVKKPKGRMYWMQCYRGSILPLRMDWQQRINPDTTIRVIPTFGPNHIYADFSLRSYVEIDYKRIKKEMNSLGKLSEYGFPWVAKNSTQLENFFNRLYASNATRLTFDIETYWGFITCISFSFDGFEGVTAPIGDFTINKYERARMWIMISKVLADPKFEKNNQNIKYDWIILERHGFKVVNVRSDTMLKGNVLYSELPRGLDFWTSVYTDMSYYKDEGKEYDPRLHSRDRLYLYCAKDSISAHKVAEGMDKDLDESGERAFYEDEIAPSILIYKNMDNCGLIVDGVQKQKLNDRYLGLLEANKSALKALTGDDKFNARSSEKVGELIYEQLRYPVRKKLDPETGEYRYKTDKDTLDDLLINYGETAKGGKIGYAILSRVILIRKLYKVLEYINTLLHPDGTLRGSFNLAGTENGRSSCAKTIDERLLFEFEEGYSKSPNKLLKLGRSLQTITKHGFTVDEDIFNDIDGGKIANDLRSMFVPPRGFSFIEGDGNSAEARVVFVLAEDFEGLADCDRKPKKHAKTAAMLYPHLDVSQIFSETPSIPKIGLSYYMIGKKVRHAGNYDMGPFRLAQMTHLPLHECTSLLEDKFHRNEPAIRGVFHHGVKEAVKASRMLKNPWGRTKRCLGRLDTDKEIKELLAVLPQGTISDLTKFTMWRVAEDLAGYMKDYFFLTEQHDGILSAVRNGYEEAYIESFKKHYQRGINFNNCSLSRDIVLSIPAEMSMSRTNWQDLEEIK